MEAIAETKEEINDFIGYYSALDHDERQMVKGVIQGIRLMRTSQPDKKTEHKEDE